jgi:gas vesicle protein
MGQDPDRIQQQLEETRAQLAQDRPAADVMQSEIDGTRSQIGDTVGALGHKADVKGRMTESVSNKKNAVVGAVGSGKNAVVGKVDALVSTVSGAVPDGEQVAAGAAKVGVSKQNPVGMVIGGAAVGLLAGLMIPSTRMEDEQIGDIAEQMKETVKETGSEALQRSKQVAQDVATAASDSASEQSQELTETLQDNVKQADPSPAASSAK